MKTKLQFLFWGIIIAVDITMLPFFVLGFGWDECGTILTMYLMGMLGYFLLQVSQKIKPNIYRAIFLIISLFASMLILYGINTFLGQLFSKELFIHTTEITLRSVILIITSASIGDLYCILMNANTKKTENPVKSIVE